MSTKSIIESYVNSLYESDKLPAPKKSKGIEAGDLEGPVDELEPNDNLTNVDLETAEKPEHLQGVSEEGVKTINMKKLTAFDRLYKRAINEDFDDLAGGGAGSPEGDAMGDMGGGMPGDESGDDFGDEMGGEGDEVSFTLDRATAEKLHEVLGQVLGGGSEDGLGDDMGDEGDGDDEYSEYEDEDSDEPVTEEEVDAEELGTPIEHEDKLNAGMTKHNNRLVKGAVPNPGGKADTGLGKRGDGKLSPHSDTGKALQGKGSMKVPSRNSNVGKFALED